MDINTLRKKIQKHIDKSGKPARHFCREVGVDPAFLSRLMSGQRNGMRLDSYLKLCKVLKIKN